MKNRRFEGFTLAECVAGGVTIGGVSYAASRIRDDYNAPYNQVSAHIHHLETDLRAVHRTEAITGTSAQSQGLHQFLGSKATKINQEIGTASHHEPPHISSGIAFGLGLSVAVAAGIFVGKAVSATRRLLYDGDVRFEEALKAMQHQLSPDQPETQLIEVEAA